MTKSFHILILEDNPADAELAQFELKEAGLVFTAKVVMTKKDYVRELQESTPDLILSDYDLPAYNGVLALAEAKKRRPDTPFILLTGAVSEDRAIEILTQGAKDYVLKARLRQRLVPAVSRALSEAEEHRARKQAEAELREAYRTMEQRVKIMTAELGKEMAERKKVLRESDTRESEHFIELRRQAEKRLEAGNAAAGPSRIAGDTLKLLQELQIYQIELEILNEELRQSKNETSALLTKYLDFYDFAPIGFFILNTSGVIMQVNLTGAELLGVERSCLNGRQMRLHIAAEYQTSFNAFFRKTLEGETIERCELLLSRKRGAPSLLVLLEARLSEDRKECNLIMIDITKSRPTEKESAEHAC
jgi:PAS domain S-box-containing protein